MAEELSSEDERCDASSSSFAPSSYLQLVGMLCCAVPCAAVGFNRQAGGKLRAKKHKTRPFDKHLRLLEEAGGLLFCTVCALRAFSLAWRTSVATFIIN